MPDPLLDEEPDARRFEEMMRWVARWFNVLPLPEAMQRLGTQSLPPRALCITFDDGYGDNRRVALPILQRFGLTATFFIATRFIAGGRMWNDSVIEAVRTADGPVLKLHRHGLADYSVHDVESKRATIKAILTAIRYRSDAERSELVTRIVDAVGIELPSQMMMREAEIRELQAAGMTIGGHTVSHPILARLEDSDAESEIRRGRAELEDVLGSPVTVFAYPNGRPGTDYDERHVRMVQRLGFEGAVATHWGVARTGTCRFELPRFTPWDRTRLRFGARMAHNLSRRARKE